MREQVVQNLSQGPVAAALRGRGSSWGGLFPARAHAV
jgi:hypothetical protein